MATVGQSSAFGRRRRCSVKGPVWSAAEQAVWFVDIKAPAIHRFHPATGEQRSWPAPARVGLRAAHTRRLAGSPGSRPACIASIRKPATSTLLHVVEPHAPNNRLNDGFVDSEGFLWFGSMDDNEEEPSGALYQLGAEGCVRRDPGYVVTNGPAESPDGRMLYHTDTLAGVIYAFDRARAGTLTNKRVFARLPAGEGYPDGPIVDAEGCVWTGLFGGWGLQSLLAAGRAADDARAALLHRDQGRLRRRRPDDSLHHQRARARSTPKNARQQPLAGGLFRARVDVPGLPQGVVTHGI